MAKQKEPESLYEICGKCATDRRLRDRFAAAMEIHGERWGYASLYTPEILYLFRCDGMPDIIADRARILAEALYLTHRAKYGRKARRPAGYLCIVTPEAGMLVRTEDLKEYFLISKTPDYDWDLEPARPDAQLIQDLRKAPALREAAVCHWQDPAEEKAFLEKLALCQAAEQLTIFSYAEEAGAGPAGEADGTGQEPLKEAEETGPELSDEPWVETLYLDRIMGRPVDESRLQLFGEFYTPLPFAEKAIAYLGRVVGPQWWTTGRYRLWDMAAGTGNLEYILPPEAQRYCYLSTLSEKEAEYDKKMFPGATVFQYDYLNDDVDFMEYAGLETMGIRRKLPGKLQEELKNPSLRWIILLNPPYSAGRDSGEECIEAEPIAYGRRTWATTTKIQQLMMAEGLGLASRDLPSQFLYRIHREFAGREAYLGLLSRLGYLTAAHNEGIRDAFFRYRYEKGFLFSSMNFKGCKHKFPYGFLVWNLNYPIPLEEQELTVDVYNRAVEKTGTVRITVGEAPIVVF